MKKLLFSSLLLCTFPLVGACGNNNEQATTTQSQETTKKDYIKEAESFIDDDKMYQAQDMLETAKEEGNSEQKEQADAILEQIDLYQTALDNTKDERYDVALDNLDKVIDEDNGSAAMKDKAYEEKDKVRDLQDEKEEEEDKKQEEEKDKKAKTKNSASVGGGSSWNSGKTQQLYSFMDSWASQMRQTYYEMDFDESVITLGNYSVDDLVDGTATPIVNGRETTFNYDGSSGYEVVAVYDGATNDGTDTCYVFAIGPGGPVALVAQGLTNGRHGGVSFKPTANQALQNGFANIANS